MDKKQTIKRAKHGKENPYFLMARATAQDESLSYEARGMLAYLLSKPGDWEVSVDDLIVKSEDKTLAGKSKVYSILSELADAGYVRKPRRYRDANNHFQWTSYEVYERPVNAQTPLTDFPDMGGPDTGGPSTEKPDNKIIQNTDHAGGIEREEKREERDAAVVHRPTVQQTDAAVYGTHTEAYQHNIPPHIAAFEERNNATSHEWVKVYTHETGLPTYRATRQEMELIVQYASKFSVDDYRVYLRDRLKDKPGIKLLWALQDMPAAMAKRAAQARPVHTMSPAAPEAPRIVMTDEERQAALVMIREGRRRMLAGEPQDKTA